MPMTIRPAVTIAQATGVTKPTSAPLARPTDHPRMLVGRTTSSGGNTPPTTGPRTKSANPTATTATCPGRNVEAARPTAAKNATTATAPTVTMAIGAGSTGPYRTTTAAAVAITGTMTATIARIADAEIHFDRKIVSRLTG